MFFNFPRKSFFEFYEKKNLITVDETFFIRENISIKRRLKLVDSDRTFVCVFVNFRSLYNYL